MKEYFRISVSKYDKNREFEVVRPSSLNNPKDHSIMFITQEHIREWRAVLQVKNCLVVWPEQEEVPKEAAGRHVIIKHREPRLGYALLFRENQITYRPKPSEYEIIDGVYIEKGAKIGKGTVIFPGAYIGAEADIGENCYIGSGVRLVGSVRIGNETIIRENTVIGSDGLTTRRDEEGKVVTIPQFGGVVIESNVQIGALTVIARGAIDDTVIHSGCRIDNSCFISHNVQLGEDTLVVGESIFFGSSSTGKQAFISGNSTVRDGISIGEGAFVGMGSVVTASVLDGKTVKGNPAG